MGNPSQKTCKLCREIFQSRYLAYLHVWVIHPSVPPTSIFNEVVTTSPLREGRIRIYQTTLELLAKDTLALSQRRTDDNLSRNNYDFLMIWNRDAGGSGSIARLIARGYNSTRKLSEIFPHFDIRNEMNVWKAVEEDTIHVVRVLKALCARASGQEAVIELGRNATYSESFLSLVAQIEKEPRYWPAMCGVKSSEMPSLDQAEEGNAFKQNLIYLSIKIAQKSDQLPEAIFITGVKLKDKTPVGGGAFADIFYGEYNGKLVAVKKLRAFLEETAEIRERNSRAFCREALTWKLLKHPHILEFCGVSRDLFPGTFCMVSLWLNHGNISQYIRNVGFITSEVNRLLFEVASGLSYLHDHEAQIVHGDLRGPNILIDDGRHARLSDFGLSNFAGFGFTGSSRSANTPWTPPEGIDPQAFGLSSSRPIPASDIFAFAGICWEVHNGRPPFADLRQPHAITSISRGKRPFREDSALSISTDLWALMTKCWRHDYRSRPTAPEVVTACALIARSVNTTTSSGGGRESSRYPSNNSPKSPSRPPQLAAKSSASRPQQPAPKLSDLASGSHKLASKSPEPVLRRQTSQRFETATVDDRRPEIPTVAQESSVPQGDGPQAMAMAMPEPWSAIPYEIRRSQPQQRPQPHVTFRLSYSTSSHPSERNETPEASTDTAVMESSSELVGSTDEDSEAGTSSAASDADSESTAVPVLNARLTRMHITQGPQGGSTRRSHTPPYGDPQSVPTGIAPSTSYPLPSTGSSHQLQRMASFSYTNPVAVAAAHHPILVSVPISQPIPPRFIPICDGSCFYYNPLLCPVHNPALSPTQLLAPYAPPYL